MAHLLPSAIFSPSVARQQLAAAKDWNYIDSWLSTKFSGRTPPFERNKDTLKALLALATLNESADEERDLLARVEAKALYDLQTKEEDGPNAQLMQSLEASLTREGLSTLEVLAVLSEEFGQSIADVVKMGRSMIDLQVTTNHLDQASDRISALERHMNTELDTINILIKDLQSDTYQAPTGLAKETSSYQRQAKVLAAKLPEIKDRVASLSAAMGSSKITIGDVKLEEDKFRELMGTVKDLEAQLKSYHGLPQDTDLARLELETVRVELRDLTQQRDSMFEGLVERESPKRRRQ